MKKPVPPSNFRSKDPDTQVDLRRVRDFGQDALDWIAAQKTDLSGYSTTSQANALYLKRAANDYNTFAHAASPSLSNRLLYENGGTGAKEYSTLTELAAIIGGSSSFNPITDIAPEFYWRASNAANTLSGGRYTTLAALGSDPTTFGTIGTQAPLQGTDSDGNVYVQFDGTAGVLTAMQQSGASSTFKFMHDGTTPWTIVLVHYYSPISGASIYESILDNAGNSSANTGFELENSNDGGGSSHGPWFGLYSSAAGTYVHSLDGRQDITGQAQVPRKEIWVVRLWPTKDRTTAGGITTSIVENMLFRQGVLIGYSNRNGNYANTNPSFLLTLGRSAVAGTAKYWNGRLYELMITKRALSDRQLAGLCLYANSTYKVVC